MKKLILFSLLTLAAFTDNPVCHKVIQVFSNITNAVTAKGDKKDKRPGGRKEAGSVNDKYSLDSVKYRGSLLQEPSELFVEGDSAVLLYKNNALSDSRLIFSKKDTIVKDIVLTNSEVVNPNTDIKVICTGPMHSPDTTTFITKVIDQTPSNVRKVIPRDVEIFVSGRK